MADYTTVISDAAVLDDTAVIALHTQDFLIASAETNSVDQFATIRADVMGKSMTFPKFAQTALATTALTDGEDPASTVMADSAVTLTPAEHGQVITTTSLANLQSGGKADTAASRLVGINAGRTQNKLAITALEASSNVLTVDGGLETALTGTDVMTAAFLNQLYNKLARASVPKFAGDAYVAVLHDDVIYDLRTATGAGSWMDTAKYAAPEEVFMNEVGMLAGFRIIRNNDITINADAGSTTVDTYHSICLGMNGLGKAVSKAPGLVMKPAGDKLDRLYNFGWYGVFKYGIIDTDACWVGTTASSIGANT